MMFLASCQSVEETVLNNDEQDPLHILVATIYKIHAKNPSNFSTTSHLNVEELETYKQAMSRPHAQ